MRTRSQAKKEKLDKEKPKVPQLNEDVFRIILKHVIKKQRKHVITNFIILDDEMEDLIIFEPVDGFDLRSASAYRIEWPDYLNSNIRRLIHHTNVKLFPHSIIKVDRKIERLIKSKQDLDTLWDTFKYYRFVCLIFKIPKVNRELVLWPKLPPAIFFRRLWQRMQNETLLMERIEARLAKNTKTTNK